MNDALRMDDDLDPVEPDARLDGALPSTKGAL